MKRLFLRSILRMKRPPASAAGWPALPRRKQVYKTKIEPYVYRKTMSFAHMSRGAHERSTTGVRLIGWQLAPDAVRGMLAY
jgi:hypothetical protein